MENRASVVPGERSPLEGFVRRYVDSIGGTWDEVEPQVYDVLFPDGEEVGSPGDASISRIAFDPEALPEHPGSQLASIGAPLVDRVLADAVRRGRFSRLHVLGLNLAPRELETQARRWITAAPGVLLEVQRCRPLDFPQAVFWFRAIFLSDQKEEEIVPVAMDLHGGRQVRHLDRLLDPARLAESPLVLLPEARCLSAARAYLLARERVLRTIAALAGSRRRELDERVERQVVRMAQYYADLRRELEEGARRAPAKEEGGPRLSERLAAIEREERSRTAEVRQRSTLRLELRLVSLLVVHQPKVSVRVSLSAPGRQQQQQQPPPSGAKGPLAGTLDVVWDPLVESFEAASCPECQRPGFAFGLDRQSRVVCVECASKAAAQPQAARRLGRREA